MKVFKISIEKVDLNEREVQALKIILGAEGLIGELWDSFKELRESKKQIAQLFVVTNPDDIE